MNISSLLRRVGALVAVVALAALLTAPAAQAARPAERSIAPAALAKDVDCTKWRSAVAGLTKWAKVKSDCSYVSAASPVSKPAFKGFAWAIPPGSNGRICVQARGYGWDKKAKKATIKWYSMGCGTSGSGTVPWHSSPFKHGGKNYYYGAAAMPEIRAKVQPGFLGAAYAWRQ